MTTLDICGTGKDCKRSTLPEPACSTTDCWEQRGFVDAERYVKASALML